MSKNYNIERSPLYNLKSKKKLAELLMLPEDYFKVIHEYKYSQFFKKKPNGTNRVIDNPEESLKVIQKRIFKLLSRINKPDFVISGTKGKSYVDNARVHKDKQYICTIDIETFYDSTKEIYVYDFFRHRMKMDVDIATILTKLCTYQGKIPTGTSVSQLLAFWAYEKTFLNIESECKNKNVDMTLYVDDITLSSNKIIDKSLIKNIDVLLHQKKLKIKKEKTKLYTKNKHKSVTGVVINNRNEIKLENKKRKQILDLYKECLNPLTITAEKLSKLDGKLNDAKQVEPGIYSTISIFIKKHRSDIEEYNKTQYALKRKNKKKLSN